MRHDATLARHHRLAELYRYWAGWFFAVTHYRLTCLRDPRGYGSVRVRFDGTPTTYPRARQSGLRQDRGVPSRPSRTFFDPPGRPAPRPVASDLKSTQQDCVCRTPL